MPDPSSAVAPGASVAIKDNTKGTIHATKTDREGVYLFFSGAGAIADGYSRWFSKGDSSCDGPVGSASHSERRARNCERKYHCEGDGRGSAHTGRKRDVSTTMNQKQISEVPNPGNDLTYIAQTVPGVVT